MSVEVIPEEKNKEKWKEAKIRKMFHLMFTMTFKAKAETDLYASRGWIGNWLKYFYRYTYLGIKLCYFGSTK